MRPLTPPRRHRNITVKRLILDAYQFVRCQSFVSKRVGKPFRPSRKYAEIDVTYKCNLKCINCNRSCSQAPTQIEMPVSMVEGFVQQSVERRVAWERIRILGGEPTLHSRIFDIIDLLIAYRRVHNPSVRLVLCTNFHGYRVHRVLEKLPEAIFLKSTLKSSRVNLFRPFNVAPRDTVSTDMQIIPVVAESLKSADWVLRLPAITFVPSPAVSIGSMGTVWEGENCRMKANDFPIRWRPFVGCAAILASSGLRERKNNRKRGAWRIRI